MSAFSSKMLLVLLRLVVVVRTDFLHEPVVRPGEGYEDTDDLKRFGADPRGLGLGVLRVAGLSRVIQTGLGLLGAVRLLVLDPTVELGHHHHVFVLLGRRGARGLRSSQKGGNCIRNQNRVLGLGFVKSFPFYGFRRWHDTDRNVAQTGRVVTKVNAECPVNVVDDLPRHQEAEFDCFHVEVKVPPAQDLLGFL